jgi:molybdopterin-guanine dinucleotide biosynthesis protein A
MQRAAGFVVAGGRSSRLGQDKARLKIHSQFLIEIVAREVEEAAGNVTLIGNPQSFADLPFACLPDLQTGLGPLAGLEAALASERAEFNLVVGCDMPDIKFPDLRRLLTVAVESKALCTVARDASERKHPLCAVYRNAALPFVRAALDAGRLRLWELVEELKAAEVRFDTVFTNLNTPEDWAAWQAAQASKRI